MGEIDKEIRKKDQELQEKSMEISKEILHDITGGLSPGWKIVLYLITSIGFLTVCLVGIFGKYDHQDNFWLLLALLPFSIYIPEKKLFHDLIEAFIELLISVVKIPKNSTDFLKKKFKK